MLWETTLGKNRNSGLKTEYDFERSLNGLHFPSTNYQPFELGYPKLTEKEHQSIFEQEQEGWLDKTVPGGLDEWSVLTNLAEHTVGRDSVIKLRGDCELKSIGHNGYTDVS